MRTVNASGLAAGRRARLQAEASQWTFYTGDPATATLLAEEAISRIGLDELDCPPRVFTVVPGVQQGARDRGPALELPAGSNCLAILAVP